MRHVPYDPNNICYPPNWKSKAAAALAKVKVAAHDKKVDEIKKYSPLWKELKPELSKVVGSKCWYTEAPQVGTDVDVDHFRPKSSVKDVKKPSTGEKHNGYWWLAFDPANYRFSCIIANRPRRDIETGFTGGKVDEFPLWDDSCRAWEDTDDCSDEQPLLIDPCKASEVAYLTYAENGEAIARHKETDRPRQFKMADSSIKLYHLNHGDFVKARIKLRVQLLDLVADAKRYYNKLESGDATNDYAYERAIRLLREAIHITAPFSGFAWTVLEPYRDEESLLGVFPP